MNIYNFLNPIAIGILFCGIIIFVSIAFSNSKISSVISGIFSIIFIALIYSSTSSAIAQLQANAPNSADITFALNYLKLIRSAGVILFSFTSACAFLKALTKS